MIIALTVSSPDVDGLIDERFGRAAGFIIHNSQSDQSKYVPNTQNLHAVQGAGIQAAQTICNTGAEAIITGHCGPKAFKVLSQAGVKVYLANNVTVKEAIEKYNKNELTEAENSDVEGHW